MLNYLRDPNQELPAEQQADVEQKKEQDYLTVATKEKDVRRSTTILGVLFIIGLICLGIMIKKSSPQAAVAKTVTDTEELRIEKYLAELMGGKNELFGKMDEIVKKFYEFSDVYQVQVGELVKNPFQLESLIGRLNADSDNNTKIDPDMIIREDVRQRAKDLKLYSTMESEKGVCCMVNNEILYEGEKIDDFVVKKIDKDSAILEMAGVEITLKIAK